MPKGSRKTEAALWRAAASSAAAADAAADYDYDCDCDGDGDDAGDDFQDSDNGSWPRGLSVCAR